MDYQPAKLVRVNISNKEIRALRVKRFFLILKRLYLSNNRDSKFIWSETRNSNLFYILSLKTRKANLFSPKLEIETSFIL